MTPSPTIDGVIQRSLDLFVKGAGFLTWDARIFIKGVGFLTRDTGIFVERVCPLTLGLRVIKWMRGFANRMCSLIKWVGGFIEWVGKLVERVYFITGEFGTNRGVLKPSSGPKHTRLYHHPSGSVGRDRGLPS